ncbi:MAG: Ig-like domain-containing protein, partial [Verrucomicrobiota bacterium]
MGVWAALLAGRGAWAADLAIQAIRVEDDGQVAVEFPSDASQYYLLFRSENLGQSGVPVALRLGRAGSDILREAAGPGVVARFYRLRQVPRAEPLDVDLDGIPDVFELEHPASLNPLNSADAAQDPDGDGRANLEEFRAGGNPDVADNVRPAGVVETSPAHGETGVSVNRETVVYFSRPLAAGSTLGPTQFYAGSGGRRLLSRAEVSSDRRKASLFVLEPMPSGSRVSVVLDATGLKDEQGVEVDADGDGRAGGLGVFQFETFSAAALARTAVIGRVFASDPVAVAGNPGVFTNRALANVTITVDGAEETLRTTTDAEG